MASPTRWTWVWVNSGSWWWTGRPGVLQSMGSQRVGHDWVAELNVCMFIKWDDHVECRNLLIKFSLIKKKRERPRSPKNSYPLLPHEDVVKRPAAIYGWNLDLGLSNLQDYEEQLSVVYKPPVYFVTAAWIDRDKPPALITTQTYSWMWDAWTALEHISPSFTTEPQASGLLSEMTWRSWVFLILALLSYQFQW